MFLNITHGFYSSMGWTDYVGFSRQLYKALAACLLSFPSPVPLVDCPVCRHSSTATAVLLFHLREGGRICIAIFIKLIAGIQTSRLLGGCSTTAEIRFHHLFFPFIPPSPEPFRVALLELPAVTCGQPFLNAWKEVSEEQSWEVRSWGIELQFSRDC